MVRKCIVLSSGLYSKLGATLVLLALLLLWEIAVTGFSIAPWLLPSPSSIILALTSHWQLIVPHLGQTLFEVLTGMTIAIVTGVACATAIDYSPTIRRILYPLLVISQTIPVIVLAPLFVIWFGFGILPKLIVITIFCFFPIAVNTADGLASADDDLIDLVRSMNADWWQIWSKICLPSALPSFFSGLKIATSYSVIAAVVGEWVGAEQGLGIYLLRMSGSFQTDKVFAIIVVISLLSLILVGTVLLIERLVIPWHNNG